MQGDIGLLPLLSKQGERDDGQFRVGTTFKYGGCGGGGHVDIAGDEQLEVLAAAGMANLHVEVLLGEVPLFLRDVGCDEGQIGLGLEAGHEHHFIVGSVRFVIATGDGKDSRDKENQEEDANHAPNSTRLGSP